MVVVVSVVVKDVVVVVVVVLIIVVDEVDGVSEEFVSAGASRIDFSLLMAIFLNFFFFHVLTVFLLFADVAAILTLFFVHVVVVLGALRGSMINPYQLDR